MKDLYQVKAVKWAEGWELHVEGVGVTQCRTLDKAESTARDYLESFYDENSSMVSIHVTPDLGELNEEIAVARSAVAAAAAAQRAAGEQSRRIATHLRRSGYSVTDTAAVLGVSRGRVSQLVNH